MNKLKMAAVQERLKLKRVQIDTWATREKLCLASAVLRSGDQNWVSVSRTLRSFDELNRPPDWFSQKNCALQYSSLLEKVDTPKRKRGERGEVHVETPGESIVRKLTSERVEELKKSIEMKRSQHQKLQEEIAQVRSGQADDRLDEMLQEIEEEKRQKKREAEIHAQWLKEREEKLLEIKRAWKPPAGFSSSSASASSTSATGSSPHQPRDPENSNRQSSSQSEQSSEAESLVDSPLSEPLQVDVIGDESLEGQVETKPSSPVRESSPQPNSSIPQASSAPSTPTPTSPLLTSLLKSPSQASSLQASSILHSAITAQRGSSPTITSLLNSSPGVPVSGTAAMSPSVSVGIKSLVTTAISSTASEDHSEKTPTTQPSTSPSAGAPTLSMLLELPPSLPGKPLPEIPTLPPKVSSTPHRETVSASPVTSPPASPQALQESSSAPSDVPVNSPEKEGETEKEISTQPQEESVFSENLEKQSELTSDVENEDENKVDDSLNQKLEKPELTSEAVVEMTSESKPQPETNSVKDTNSASHHKFDKWLSVKESEETEKLKNELEPVEESTETSAIPDVPEVCIAESKPVEVKQETSTAEMQVSSVEDVQESTNDEVSPVEDISKTKEELLTTSNEEGNVQISELKAENLPVEEVEDKEKVGELPEKIVEVVEDASIEEQHPSSTLDSMLPDEPLLPESTPIVRKDEGTPELATEEKEILDKTPYVENPQTESLTTESGLRKRGGGRGRKFRGRALTLYRMRQERKARDKIDKENVEAYKMQDDDSDNSARETATAPACVLEDTVSKEMSEARKGSVVDDEISNLKSEWDEDAADDGLEDEKKESATSQKKVKIKKVEGTNEDSKQKIDVVENIEKSAVKSVAGEEAKKDSWNKTEDNIEEYQGSEVSKAIIKEKSLTEVKDDKEKKTVSAKIDDDLPKKSPEMKKEEGVVRETESSSEKKLTAEKKTEDKKLVDKKAENKGKQIPSDKKLDDKERKKPKDSKIEKKDKKVDADKKVEEAVVEERNSIAREEEKKAGKEKRIEIKERKSSSERRAEVGDKKHVKEKKSEEKEEKSDGEKRILEKGFKELEPKKAEVERKVSRERKFEEKEKKTTSERKMEEIKRKSVDEKRAEETERSKSSEKEISVQSKKSLAVHSSEKSRTLVASAVSNSAQADKLKRKIEHVEDSGVGDKSGPSYTKQTKHSEEVANVQASESDKETSEIDKKMEEESAAKRKGDRRKGVVSKHLDNEDSLSKGGSASLPAEEKEKTSEVDSTPKSSVGRRRGIGTIPLTSTPGTPFDQIPSSPASSQSISEEERDYRAWKKAILLVWSRLATHKYASIFLRPITNDQAPGYHNVVFRPVDLHTIKKNVENGVIRTTAHFQRDVMLMFLNAIMYNSSDHDVHRMSFQMQQESLQHIQILLEASEAPKILRRETREGNKRSDSSTQMHFTPSASHDETSSSAGVTASASSTQTPGISSVSAVPSSSNSVSSSSLAESSTVTDAKVGGSNKEGGVMATNDREATPLSSKRKRGSTFGSVQQGEERAAKKQRFHRSSAGGSSSSSLMPKFDGDG